MLKKYKEVYDFIIFGSTVKDKMLPADLDLAIITSKRDPGIIGDIKTQLDRDLKNAHLQIFTYEDFIKSKLPYYALTEGFSVKKGKFISKIIKTKRNVLYWFDLKDLPQSQKVMFNKALREIIKTEGFEKLGKGVILVSVNKSGEIEDFLNQWKRKINKKDFIEI